MHKMWHAAAMADEPEKQIDKFQELARKLDCDEDEAKFEAQVRGIAKRRVKPGEPGSPEVPKDDGD
jgi:hypothetical protein